MQRACITVVTFLLTVSGSGSARADAPDCHAFEDVRGDAPSPAVDVLRWSLQAIGGEVVSTVTVEDLSAPLSPGADMSTYHVFWHIDDSFEQGMLGARSTDGWSFHVTGTDMPDVAVRGSVEGNTVTLAIPSESVGSGGSHRVARSVGATADQLRSHELPPSGGVVWLGGDDDMITGATETHSVGIDTACRSGVSTDTATCPVLLDPTGDVSRRAGTELLPWHVANDVREIDLRLVTLESADGRLNAEMFLADLGTSTPGTVAAYELHFDADGSRYFLVAARGASGWSFSGSGPDGDLTVTGVPFVSDDVVRMSVPLSSIPEAAAGRGLGSFYAEARNNSIDPPSSLTDEQWDFTNSIYYDGGWFVAGGGCAPDDREH